MCTITRNGYSLRNANISVSVITHDGMLQVRVPSPRIHRQTPLPRHRCVRRGTIKPSIY